MASVGATWRAIQKQLEQAGVDPAPREGMWIARHVLGGEGSLALREHEELNAVHEAQLGVLLSARLTGMPLAYVLGLAEFAGRDWRVTEDVLIPRPDTETLLEAAVAALPQGPARVAEVGVGSGAVIGALLLRRKDVTAVGTDISPRALAVALQNWQEAGVADRIEAVPTDLLAHVDGPFDVILSNPPYIATAEYGALDAAVRGFEPKIALEAGADGLDAYRRLIPQAAQKLAKNGALVLEIGWKQAGAVAGLLQQDQWHDTTTLQDLAGRDRVVLARRR